MTDQFHDTTEFIGNKDDATRILHQIIDALKEKGYSPSNQLVGYLISGDPSYITSYKDARNLIQNMERDELMELVVRFFIENMENAK